MRTPNLSRRALLAGSAAALGAAMSGEAAAAPFFQRARLPIGLQLYTLGPEAGKDLDATLAAVAKIGYRDVEFPGFLGHTPKDIRAALDRAGLKCSSIHIQARAPAPDGFEGDLAKLADALSTIGATHAVAPVPYFPDHAMAQGRGQAGVAFFQKVTGALTADDWKMNADLLNTKAAALAKSGIKVGYHNHNFEFAPLGATNGMEILLAGTDPKLVTFEADVGWMGAAGVDPLAYIQKHKGRFTLMHVKDIKPSTKPNFGLLMDPTEVGAGRIDWKRLLPGAHAAGVSGFYVEQEPPFERPRIEAAKLCHDFLARVEA